MFLDHAWMYQIISVYSGAQIIRTKNTGKIVQIKQNEQIIHTSKSIESMEKYTIVRIMII